MKTKLENKILKQLLIRIYKMAKSKYKETHSEFAHKILVEFRNTDLRIENEINKN